MLRRPFGATMVALVAIAAAGAAHAAPPSIIFILLDTTRADRLGAWGNPRPTSPTLDRLAAGGALFHRHFANSHATRPSMPQLMSGRYYHQSILGPFQTDANPREMSFAKPDPTATILPAVLRANGYATVAVSAHTWVAPDSTFGSVFEHFELLTTADAHGDGAPLVDRAVTLWKERDRNRPLFLYLHFMDMHMPRRLPGGIVRFPVAGYDWQRRFRADGEPSFDRNRRRWSRHDARDFTRLDRAYYTAVYDTRLQYTDEQLSRLVATVRAEDPELRETLIVVTADHGEELGEEGRIEHGDSLADGVQHVPWIVTGGSIAAAQRCDAMTEHVDVLPSLLSVLQIALPDGVSVDGSARLKPDGRLAQPCGETTAYYAWEDYRAVRAHHYLLEHRMPGSFAARCDGEERLYHVDGLRRRLVVRPQGPRRARLRALLEGRLAAGERAYLAHRYGTPTRPFFMRSDFWQLAAPSSLRCVPVDEDTPRSAFDDPGWLWTGRGVTVFDGLSSPPLRVRMAIPPGTYEVEAAGTPIGRRPWLFGFPRWRRTSFLPEEPSQRLPLGRVEASGGSVEVAVPVDVAAGHHVLGLRFSPPGATGAAPAADEGQRERLKALGYVQ